MVETRWTMENGILLGTYEEKYLHEMLIYYLQMSTYATRNFDIQTRDYELQTNDFD